MKSFEEMTAGIKGDLKKIPPLGWGVIAVGAGFGIYLFTKSSATTSTIDSQGTAANTTGTDTSSTDSTLSQMADSTNSALSSISDSITTLSNNQDDLAAKYETIAGSYSTPKTNTADVLATTATTANTAVSNAAAENGNNTVNIYHDGISDISQYQNAVTEIKNAVTSGSLTAGQAASTELSVAGLGNNGVGTKSEIATNVAAVKNSAAAKASEISRTNDVIANRKSAGLSTAAQTSYLKTLTGK